MFCVDCAEPLDPGWRACPWCGRKIPDRLLSFATLPHDLAVLLRNSSRVGKVTMEVVQEALPEDFDPKQIEEVFDQFTIHGVKILDD